MNDWWLMVLIGDAASTCVPVRAAEWTPQLDALSRDNWRYALHFVNFDGLGVWVFTQDGEWNAALRAAGWNAYLGYQDGILRGRDGCFSLN